MPITTSLSPNTQSDDIKIAIKTILTPWRWRHPSVNKTIQQQLSSHLDNRPTVLVSSGRAAIFRTLQALDIKQGDEVLIQAFTCLAVTAPVQWTKAKPIYVDIDPNTYNYDLSDIKRKITPRTKAIIVQHTFGIAGPIQEILQLAKTHHFTVIEDLAHGFGADLQGKPLGTFGDVTILSFGRDKTISCVFGGAVSSHNSTLIQKIKSQQEALPQPPFWWVKQQLLHPILMSIIVPLYFTLSLGKFILVASQKLKFLSMAVTSCEKRGLKPPFIDWQFSPALGFLLQHQLTKLDQFTEWRRAIAKKYEMELNPPQPVTYSNRPNWIRFPIKVKNRQALLAQAKKNHILLGTWYDQPVTPSVTTSANPTKYQSGLCPNAELAANEAVNLPTHPRLSDHQVDQVINLINKHGS